MNLSSPIHLCVFVFSLTTCLAQEIIRGPYLQVATPNSITIRWRTDLSTDTKLWYGDSPSNLTSFEFIAGNRIEHQIDLSGLNPATTYFYAVGDSSGTLNYDNIGDLAGQAAGGDTIHYFTTSPTSGTTQPISIWVLGDAGTHDANQRAVRDAFYNYNGSPHVDLILQLGDNAYEDGLDSEYQVAWFEDMYETSLINSILWPVVGNHDLHYADSEDETGPYYDIFDAPRNGEAGGVASGTEAYYSFDYANIHFIALNSEDISQEPGSPQLIWLQNDLNTNAQQWTVAMIHRAAYYSSGDVRSNIVPILESAGVDLVLYGHRHVYQRSFLMDGHYGDEGTFDSLSMTIDGGDGRPTGDGPYLKQPEGAANSGTVHLITGSAGKDGNLGTIHPFLISYVGEPTMGSVHMEVDGSQMDVRFITDNGTVFDHFVISKGIGAWPNVSLTSPVEGTTFPLIQPITIAADATDSDGQVTQVEFFANGNSIGIDFTPPFSISWSPTKGIYDLQVKATDNDLNVVTSNTSRIFVEVFSSTGGISMNSDDAEQKMTNNKVSLNSSDLELAVDDTIAQIVGMRFLDLQIPKNVEIDTAFIQFTVDEVTNINPCSLVIEGQKNANPATFTNNTNDLGSRPKTQASTVWQPNDWLAKDVAGFDQTTPDLTDVLQEIVDQGAYSASSPIAIFVSGTGTRVAISHNKNPAQSPTLAVIYSKGSCIDGDSDGVCDEVDNCELISNPMQEDMDGDGIGDLCDNCPSTSNPNQVDTDQDGQGDTCDACPLVSSIPLQIDNQPIPSGTYHTTSSITSAGHVASDSTVIFKAGEAIDLNPNFFVTSQAIFEAHIEGCPE